MAKVVRTDSDHLNSVLTITFEKGDYEPKFKAALNKQRKNAHMKGFRKGKTPIGFIKKMYGRAILAEVINDMLQDEVNRFLKEEDIEILGQPLPADDQPEYTFEVNDLSDFTFSFDMGLAPKFEVNGLDENNSFEKMVVKVSEETIEEELNNARKRSGNREEVEDAIQENDMVQFNAEELDGDQPKENGWATTFSLLTSVIAPEIKSEILGKKKGDKLRFNIFQLETDRTEDYVRKYLLNVGENDTDVEIGEHFEGTIDNVSRLAPAELNQEFFDKTFGEGEVKSEEEARAKMEELLASQANKQGESLLFRDFQEDLLERNPLELPETFLKRWLKFSNENATDEVIEKELDRFLQNLRWSLIRSKAVQKFDIKVSNEEIFEGFKDRIRGYFGGYGDELVILNTANRLMQDEKQVDQVYQELIADRLFESICEVVDIKEKPVSREELEEELKKAREEMMADQGAPEAVVETEVNEDQEEKEITEDVEQ
ncbi:MAG: trigger factor [Bacteroidota bacterium]